MPKKKTPSANSNNDVGEALALLSETLTDEQSRIGDEGAKAMKAGDLATAREVIDFAERLIAFQNKVATLADEWEELENASEAATPEVQKIVSKHFFGKKKKGLITNQDEYCKPILEVLVEMGGKGKTKLVLDRLGEKMKGTLKPIDYECHKSNDKQIRWRNTAQWARNKMVNADGSMTKDSPNGVWEISAKGRKWLEEQPS